MGLDPSPVHWYRVSLLREQVDGKVDPQTISSRSQEHGSMQRLPVEGMTVEHRLRPQSFLATGAFPLTQVKTAELLRLQLSGKASPQTSPSLAQVHSLLTQVAVSLYETHVVEEPHLLTSSVPLPSGEHL
jgi:hypothetical protein